MREIIQCAPPFGQYRASYRRVKRALPILFIVVASAHGQVDPKEIVSQSIRNYQRDWRTARANWAWTQRDVTQSDETKVEVTEVTPLAGTPYERLVLKDGHPLASADQRKEEHKYEKARRQRENETPSEREERIRKYEGERAFAKDIPEAYNFKLLGDEVVDGRPAWVIAMTPRPEFIPSEPHSSMLGHIEGKLWIDKEEVQWAKAEAHVMDTIGIGWILARIVPGTRFTVEQTRVENGLWMPRRITITGAAHVMMVVSRPIREELTYSGYRKDGSVSAGKYTDPIPTRQGMAQSFR
jgi:hypothetical protein